MTGRILDWAHDLSPFDDWLDDIYLRLEARSRGRYRAEELDEMPLIRVMSIADAMTQMDHEMIEAQQATIAALFGARMTR